MKKTVAADPRLRKRAIILIVTACVASALFLPFFRGFLRGVESRAGDHPQVVFEKLTLIHNASLSLTLVCSTALVGLFLYCAVRVLRAGQWPPPGFRVVWEMRVRTGRQATVVAMCFLLLAVLVIADAVWLVSLPGPVPPAAQAKITEV
ncbi:MAG: hypothetical protein HOP18_25815 [Deltaproteobacteria bacterium]|nr:hypothetical protein [Deltaproteobacteria bacterium]